MLNVLSLAVILAPPSSAGQQFFELHPHLLRRKLTIQDEISDWKNHLDEMQGSDPNNIKEKIYNFLDQAKEAFTSIDPEGQDGDASTVQIDYSTLNEEELETRKAELNQVLEKVVF